MSDTCTICGGELRDDDHHTDEWGEGYAHDDCIEGEVNWCEDCAVNGSDCRTHGEAFRLARQAILANRERVIALLKEERSA